MARERKTLTPAEAADLRQQTRKIYGPKDDALLDALKDGKSFEDATQFANAVHAEHVKRNWGGSRPGAGRKPIEDRKVNLTIALRPDELDRIRTAAADCGESISEFVARALNCVQSAFAGEAQRLHVEDESDVVAMVKEVRREKRQAPQ